MAGDGGISASGEDRHGESRRFVVRARELLSFVKELLHDPTVEKLVLGNQKERVLEIPVPHTKSDIGDLPRYSTLQALAALKEVFIIDVIHKNSSSHKHDG